MEKTEKFIQEHTKKCSNVCSYNSLECEIPWLIPDQARKAVEIAREETIKEVCEWLDSHLIDYWSQSVTDESRFIDDLKKHLENKL